MDGDDPTVAHSMPSGEGCSIKAELSQKTNENPAILGRELPAMQIDAIAPIELLSELMKGKKIWLWKKGATEACLGIEKTDTAKASFIEQFSNNVHPAALLNYESIQAAMSWVRC